MGWCLEDNMKVSMVKQALNMAYKNAIHKHDNIIHHSDRGKQYCCPDYTEFAAKKGFVMSTTQKYDPYENAVAERINNRASEKASDGEYFNNEFMQEIKALIPP